MNKKIIISISVCLFCIALFFVYKFYSPEKIEPGVIQNISQSEFKPDKTLTASIKSITDWYEAVGTVKPRSEASIQAQITAQIIDVKVRPGEKVQKGQLLILLDNKQFISRLDQAKQSLKAAIASKDQVKQSVIAAKAAFNHAEIEFKRTKKYFESQAATSQNLEQNKSLFLQAKAGLKKSQKALTGADAQIRQAEEVIKEAEIALGYTKIKALENGEVLKRLIEPGDLALPGKPLIVLKTSDSLRLEAYVREGLIKKVKIGTQLESIITTLNKTTKASIEEVIPYADPQTRTFLVKALLPPIKGIYPGMFGKLLIPVKACKVVLVPEKAVRRVGQLELIMVREKDLWKTRYIKTGRIFNNKIEVLSGLSGNETIGWKS
ncbi:Efflux RND transporter periplasmic adaptor subunit [Candidatus Magnetomoraceae bacterium gMMP-1]